MESASQIKQLFLEGVEKAKRIGKAHDFCRELLKVVNSNEYAHLTFEVKCKIAILVLRIDG